MKLYNKNNLKFEFQSLDGKSIDDAGNTYISISNVKASAHVSYTGNAGGFQCDAQIYGLGMDMLAALSARGVGPYQQNNVQIGLTITANDVEIFSGGIFSSYANMNSVPEAALIISAIAGNDMMRKPASPFSASGHQPYETILSSICSANGYKLNAIGLNGIAGSNVYLVGDALSQIRDACNAANLQMSVNGKVVTVWKSGTATDDVRPLVSADYGLIGYPVFTQSGLTFQSTFSPYLSQGRYVTLQTDLPNASGIYQLFAVDHYLSSWIKGGQWVTLAQTTRVIENGN